MRERYVLILVSLNPDKTDVSGIEFPDFGYVESINYQPDKDIRKGLYGTLWGRVNGDHWLNSDKEAQWCVVKVENNDEIIELDSTCNFIKFRKGMVVSSGIRQDCSKYICSNCPNKENCNMDNCELVGLNSEEPDKSDIHVFRQGAFSISNTVEPGCHAINSGVAGCSNAHAWGAHAIAFGKNSCALTVGDEGVSFNTGTESKSMANHDLGIAINTGLKGLVSVGKRGGAIGIGDLNLARAGVSGFIALKYNDGKRDRMKIGYVGEDIEANTVYRVTSLGEFQSVKI